MEYGGKVKSSNNKQVGLLMIMGKRFLVKRGQEVEGIKVKEYSDESISLEYKNEIKTFSK